MTALLCIDTWTLRCRRYVPRRQGGALRVTDEVRILSPLTPDFDADFCKVQLEQFRAGEPVVYATFPQDHIPPAAA